MPRLSVEATFVVELLEQRPDQKQELSPTC